MAAGHLVAPGESAANPSASRVRALSGFRRYRLSADWRDAPVQMSSYSRPFRRAHRIKHQPQNSIYWFCGSLCPTGPGMVFREYRGLFGPFWDRPRLSENHQKSFDTCWRIKHFFGAAARIRLRGSIPSPPPEMLDFDSSSCDLECSRPCSYLSFSAPNNTAFAILQSRLTVSGEIPRNSAVSSTLNPPK
jgi:hypothetical protein